jgi:hypothetical protein
MTWKELLAERRVAKEELATRDEVDRLRALARRSQADAGVEELSEEGRFEHAYAAARALATLVIRASGYRVKQPAAHYNTFLALEAANPGVFAEYAAYFDICRVRRNELSYEGVEVVSETELEELLRKLPAFERAVDKWLRQNRPEIL